MANDWTSLRPCTLGTQVIPVRSMSGEWSRALVEHKYPDRDGGEWQDMGREPYQFSLQAVFYGLTYELEFQALVAQMNLAQRVLFTHPHHGTAWVRIKLVRDRESTEGARYIEADIDLVEDALDVAGFTISPAGLVGIGSLLDTAASAASAALAVLP